MTHYFITFAWMPIGRPPWRISEDITDKHPIEYITYMNRLSEESDSPIKCEHHLLSYIEINEETAEKYREMLEMFE